MGDGRETDVAGIIIMHINAYINVKYPECDVIKAVNKNMTGFITQLLGKQMGFQI